MVFTVSEPWEFEGENAGPELIGVVDVACDSKILLRMDPAFSVEKRSYEHLLCELRHEGACVDDLDTGRGVPCNGICVPGEFREEAKQLNAAWWRGAGGLVGSIRKL